MLCEFPLPVKYFNRRQIILIFARDSFSSLNFQRTVIKELFIKIDFLILTLANSSLTIVMTAALVHLMPEVPASVLPL